MNVRFEYRLKFQDILESVFFTVGSFDGEGFSQLYLEFFDAYKKRFMPQNEQVTVLKCSSISKKKRKSFKTLYELKVQIHSQKEAWKREVMAVSAGKGALLS